jgi:hypothetical protein
MLGTAPLEECSAVRELERERPAVGRLHWPALYVVLE